MVDQLSKEELLQRVPLFAGLDKKHLQRIAGLMTPITEPSGKVLASEGSLGVEFFVILEGEVEVRRGDDLVVTCKAGDYLGEIALLTGHPRSATLVTKTAVVIEVLTSQEFSSLLAAEPSIATQIMATMAERLADAEGHASN